MTHLSGDDDLERHLFEQLRRLPPGASVADLQSQVLSHLTDDPGMAGLGRFSRELPTRPRAHLPEPRQSVRLLTVRVDIDEVKPATWRRLALRSDMTIERLAEVIDAAFAWHGMHLHRFWVGPQKRIWTGPFLAPRDDEEADEASGFDDEVVLDQLLRRVGDRLFYTYDFGDGWNHTIRVEKVEAAPQDAPIAVCSAGRNAGPLEDSGGPHGYNDLVAAHRSGRLSADVRAFVPSGWDPGAFSVEEVNDDLAMVGASLDELLVQVREASSDRCYVPVYLTMIGMLEGRDVPRMAEIEQMAHDFRAGLEEDGTAGWRQLAVEPLQYVLDLARGDGIPLTSAGWLKPDLVKELAGVMGALPYGQQNREVNVHEVRELRQRMVSGRLLRKHRDRLVLAPLGRELDGDVDGLFAWFVRQIVPNGPATGEFGPLAEVGRAVWVAAGLAQEQSSHQFGELAQMFRRAGWGVSDGHLTGWDFLWPEGARFARLVLRTRNRRGDAVTSVERYCAYEALFGDWGDAAGV